MIRLALTAGGAAAAFAVAVVVAPGVGGAQDTESVARARVTVLNDTGVPITAVMTETPTASVVQPWPRTLAAGETMDAAFAFPAMSGALSVVQYALPPRADGASPTCLFQWHTDARRLVWCDVVLTARKIGVGEAVCKARLVKKDSRTCSFEAMLEVR